jgi:hypothetical protein
MTSSAIAYCHHAAGGSIADFTAEGPLMRCYIVRDSRTPDAKSPTQPPVLIPRGSLRRLILGYARVTKCGIRLEFVVSHIATSGQRRRALDSKLKRGIVGLMQADFSGVIGMNRFRRQFPPILRVCRVVRSGITVISDAL